MISALKQIFQRALLLLIMLCSLSLGWMVQPSFATSGATLADPQTMPDAEQAYEEAKQIAKDPKMGAEKAYEKEVEVFKEEHPDKNLIERSEEVADSIKTR